jgi:hypothetical protein
VARHEHDDGDHGQADEAPDDAGADDQPDVSGWVAGSAKTACPACGAPGALALGGGVFCPSCGVVTTNPGYGTGPADDPAAASDPGPG